MCNKYQGCVHLVSRSCTVFLETNILGKRHSCSFCYKEQNEPNATPFIPKQSWSQKNMNTVYCEFSWSSMFPKEHIKELFQWYHAFIGRWSIMFPTPLPLCASHFCKQRNDWWEGSFYFFLFVVLFGGRMLPEESTI